MRFVPLSPNPDPNPAGIVRLRRPRSALGTMPHTGFPPVDWGNPLTKGLRGYWLIIGGRVSYNLVTGKGDAPGNAPNTFSQDPRHGSVAYNSAGGWRVDESRGDWPSSPPVSIVAGVGLPASNPGGTYGISGLWPGTGNITGFWMGVTGAGARLFCGYGDGTSTTSSAQRIKTTSTGTTLSSKGFVTQRTGVVGCSIRPGATDMSLYMLGLDVGGAYSGTGGTNMATGTNYSIGAARQGDNGSIFPISFVAMWERSLDDREHMLMHINPFELLANPRGAAFVFIPGSVEDTLDLSHTAVLDMSEDIPGTPQTDTLTLSETAVLSLVEAVVEPDLTLSQTGDQANTVAELGDTYTLSQTLSDSLLEKIREPDMTLTATADVTITATGDESDSIGLDPMTNVPAIDDQIQGSVNDVFRLVETNQLSLAAEEIRSDVETLTISQTNTQSVLEAADDLDVTQTGQLAIDEFLPQIIETVTLSQTNLLRLSEDAEVVELEQTAVLEELPGSELAKASQTNSLAIDEVIVTPGSGFNENLTLSQTNVPSLANELIQTNRFETLDLSQTNVITLTERILSPPTAPEEGDGIEFSQVILPYSGSSYTLATSISSTTTLISLSGDVSGLPDGGFVLVIGGETVYVVSRSGNDLTVVRGWSQSTPAAHSAGASAAWNNYYDMVMSTPRGALVGDWIVMCDATQAYLDGQRFAFHAYEFRSIGALGGANKLDGSQPWRASPVVGVTDSVPGGVCQPARVATDVSSSDKIVVRYLNNVAPTGVFELGPRALLPQFWVETDGEPFARYDADGNDVTTTDPNGFIYDAQTTSGQVYADSSSLVRARELGADRYWTVPLLEGGRGKSGVHVGVLVLRNGFNDIPFWSSIDWRSSDFTYMGFADPDAMFIQVIYQSHPQPDTDDHYGPNAQWDASGYATSTAFAMFLTPPKITSPGTGGGGGGTGGPTGGGGGGIPHPTVRAIHLWRRM